METSDIKRAIELRSSVEKLEGDVFFPGETEQEIDKYIQKENEKAALIAKRKEERDKASFEPISIEWIMDNPMEAMDSCVPACCKHGCTVEPDGYCEHGQPSVLLYHGLI